MKDLTGRAAVLAIALLLPVGLWAQDVKVTGVVESTSGGLKFPDGTIQATAAGEYANVVVAAKSGGDFTSIQAALDSISDAAADNRYLVRIGPGVFSEQVTTKDYVDLAGSGARVTKIAWTGSPDELSGSLTCSNNVEIRDLTVINSGGDDYATAIFCVAAPRLLRVRARAFGATTISQSIVVLGGSKLRKIAAIADGSSTNVSIRLQSGAAAGGALLEDVTATASGGDSTTGVTVSALGSVLRRVVAIGEGGTMDNRGVLLTGTSSVSLVDSVASATGGGAANHGFRSTAGGVTNIRRSEIAATGGIINYGLYFDSTVGGSIAVNHSQIAGDTATIRTASTVTIFVGASQLDGGPVDTSNGGTVTCVNVYAPGFGAPSPTCS